MLRLGAHVQNLAFGRFGQCFVLVHDQHAPADEDWQRWVDFLSEGGAAHPSLLRVLIFSAGGSPTPTQRRALHALVRRAGPRGIRVAVVTDSAIGRAVVSVMALFNPLTRAFSAGRVEEALEHLDVLAALRPDLLRFAQQLHELLNVPFPSRK